MSLYRNAGVDLREGKAEKGKHREMALHTMWVLDAGTSPAALIP